MGGDGVKDLTKAIRKEETEHPWASYPVARKIALDHAKLREQKRKMKHVRRRIRKRQRLPWEM